jgi:hypothetical protein
MPEQSAHDYLLSNRFECNHHSFDYLGNIRYRYFHYKIGQFFGDYTKTTMDEFYEIHPSFKKIFQSLSTPKNPMEPQPARRNIPVFTKFKKAKALFQQYETLEQEIEIIKTRLKIDHYAEIISSDFVTIDIDLIREFLKETLKFKTQELEILQEDFVKITEEKDWSKLVVTK